MAAALEVLDGQFLRACWPDLVQEAFEVLMSTVSDFLLICATWLIDLPDGRGMEEVEQRFPREGHIFLISEVGTCPTRHGSSHPRRPCRQDHFSSSFIQGDPAWQMADGLAGPLSHSQSRPSHLAGLAVT